MKPFLLILLLGCAPLARAQETGKPVDFDNPRVGDYLVADGFVYGLHTDAYETLRNAVESLKLLPDWKFQLESHTDCRASMAYNDTLSQARADTLLKYVLAMGFPAWRITAKGMGERMLLMEKCSCDLTDYNSRICEEKEHQLNRRTIIRLTQKIEWTGYEPLSLKFPSAGQFRAIPFENSGDEAYHTANGALLYFLDSLHHCEDVHYTLYYLPGKRTIRTPFVSKQRKWFVKGLRDLQGGVPSRIHTVQKSPGQAFKGVNSGYVVVVDSLLSKQKILNEIGVSGDTQIIIMDVNYTIKSETRWESSEIGGLSLLYDFNGDGKKYRVLIVTSQYPERLVVYDRRNNKKWIACQDTAGDLDYIGYSERMREEFPNFPEIVEVRYVHIPELKRPWMLILQPIREEE